MSAADPPSAGNSNGNTFDLKGGRLPASTVHARWSVMSTMARSPCWRTSTTARSLTHPMTSSSIRMTVRSGSLTRATARWWNMKATVCLKAPIVQARFRRRQSIGSMLKRAKSRKWRTSRSSRTGCASHPITRSFMSPTPASPTIQRPRARSGSTMSMAQS